MGITIQGGGVTIKSNIQNYVSADPGSWTFDFVTPQEQYLPYSTPSQVVGKTGNLWIQTNLGTVRILVNGGIYATLFSGGASATVPVNAADTLGFEYISDCRTYNITIREDSENGTLLDSFIVPIGC